MTLPPWRALGLLAGLALGEGLWWSVASTQPEADLSRWTLRRSSVPLETAELYGELLPQPGVLDLAFYRGVSTKGVRMRAGEVSVRARVPEGAQLRVRLGAEVIAAGPEAPNRSLGPVAIPGGLPPGGTPPPGTPPPGTPPGQGPAGLNPSGPDGVVREVGRWDQQKGVSVLVDRAAGVIRSTELRCAPEPPVPGPELTLTLRGAPGMLEVLVDGEVVSRCPGHWDEGDVVISSGVRRVQVLEATVTPAGGTPFTDDFTGPLQGWPARVAGWALGLGAAWRALRSRRLVLAASPLLLVPLLTHLDVRAAMDALRLLQLDAGYGPLIFAGMPAAAALLAVGVATQPLGRALAWGLVPGAVQVGLLALGGDLGAPYGWVLLAALGPVWAALCWVNTHPVARRPAWSYALFGAFLLLAEAAARGSSLDATWSTTQGWERARTEFAELLEIREHRSYPTEGFPVRPPPPDPTRRRIVALGGSSTGGAYQMDDLGLFWPRRLEEHIAAQSHPTPWEVVNQGVGGWNSLHVRLYIESQIERLEPDLLILYLGHNDLLTPTPAPYSELYAHYQRDTQGGAVKAVSDALSRSRLYFGFRFLLLALRDRGDSVAVPLADARDNLQAILDLARAHNTRVLLTTEGLNPDPLPMSSYAGLQEELARQNGALFLNTAELLYQAGDPDLFLDDCHLSVEGHKRVAAWMHDALRDAGWL